MQIDDLPTVLTKTRLSKSTIWRREQMGDFPQRIRLSPGRVGWISSSVDMWIESRPRVMKEKQNEK